MSVFPPPRRPPCTCVPTPSVPDVYLSVLQTSLCPVSKLSVEGGGDSFSTLQAPGLCCSQWRGPRQPAAVSWRARCWSECPGAVNAFWGCQHRTQSLTPEDLSTRLSARPPAGSRSLSLEIPDQKPSHTERPTSLRMVLHGAASSSTRVGFPGKRLETPPGENHPSPSGTPRQAAVQQWSLWGETHGPSEPNHESDSSSPQAGHGNPRLSMV